MRSGKKQTKELYMSESCEVFISSMHGNLVSSYKLQQWQRACKCDIGLYEQQWQRASQGIIIFSYYCSTQVELTFHILAENFGK